MREIADWLGKLGLGQYAQRFAENDIDFTILVDLTDQDLEKIGISSFGHRRRILRAIVELGDVGKTTQGTPVSAEPTPPMRPRDTAERRQVTVMFSDLVGSTALSARMDPEDLREIISAYQKCVAETVQRFGGFVAKYMGDGVLVYFGYPQAHEDDAERAVRAGIGVDPSGGRIEVQRSLTNPRGHCHRVGRSRRSDRIGCCAGASGCRRDAEPCRASAGDRRAEHGRHRREHAKTSRQSVRS